MESDVTLEYEPGVLRVLQSKREIRSFYNKIAGVYDLLAEASERPMREAGLKKLAVRAGERVQQNLDHACEKDRRQHQSRDSRLSPAMGRSRPIG